MSGPSRHVAETRTRVRRALDDLAPGERVLVACSGGADSLALAAATAYVAPRAQLTAGAVVVDHGLQADSAIVAERAAETCRGLGLEPVEVVRVDVGCEGGPEGAARTARRAALEAAALRHRAVAVLVGHTLDDQAETVLLGLARGSGARSLSGMRAVDGLWRRPLLGVRRATTRRACTDQGLRPWDDPHNSSSDYARVRVRQRALPVLEDELGPGIADALARTAELLSADAELLDELAWKAVTASCQELARLHPALRSRVIRFLAVDAGCPAGSLTALHIGALDALVGSWHGQGPVALPGGLSGLRRCGTLTFVETPSLGAPNVETAVVDA